jgi:phosphopantetheinyl transferase (holo-ACP synthase)
MQNYKLYDLYIFNNERHLDVHNAFCLVSTQLEVLMQNAKEFLHPKELEYLSTLQYPRRQVTYLRGRYAAKLALKKLEPNINSTEIAILNGAFGFPYIISSHGIDAQVSISHNDAVGIASAYRQACPVAVDTEQVSPARIETIQSEMLPSEIALLTRQVANKDLGLSIGWTMKEALSKALRCGLYIDFKYLEIIDLEQKNNLYYAKFKNFGQYQTRSLSIDGSVCSFVFPQKTEFDLNKITS